MKSPVHCPLCGLAKWLPRVAKGQADIIESLEEENKCLRSVLSEWDHIDKSCFIMMNRADQLRDERETDEQKDG